MCKSKSGIAKVTGTYSSPTLQHYVLGLELFRPCQGNPRQYAYTERFAQVSYRVHQRCSTVIGPYDNIPYDAEVSAKIDWEAELAIVIGQTAHKVSREQALDYVFGYTVVNRYIG